jgi:hypothetical protein
MRNCSISQNGILLAELCATALFLAGCASTKQYAPLPDQTKRVQDPTKARIYLIRPARVLGYAVSFQFSATGPEATGPYVSKSFRMVGELGPGRYLCWERSPGPMEMNLDERNPNHVFMVHLEAGKVYYLRAFIRGGWGPPRGAVELLTNEKGESLLKQCKPPEAEIKEK